MSDSFGRYAKYIIQDRALPDIRDGLKPVQRRIIYAMNSLQLFYDKQHKKSARTVGEVIGKYHPHGDTSIYDAMVRMSQDWKNNIPLIDMHGNNGSIDGDGAAAMRYTECRLSQFGQLMIQNIAKDCVPFVNNFDDCEQEPSVLPSLLPNLLINGASGIAAGYATNIPPYNPCEVIDAVITRIDSPDCRLSSILKVMPGPDFPTGGIILGRDGINSAYETGKGKISIRGNLDLKSSKQAYITSIPYETNKSMIIRQINELAEDNPVLNIKEVRDESDKNGISIAIDLKDGKNFEFVKNFIYKNTQLQISYAINTIAIKDHKPCLMPIIEALDSFIEHINGIIVSTSVYDLNKAKIRKEIVEGLIKAIKILDDVIDVIRHSSDKASAKQNLITKFIFSEAQADAIVNLRLYRLSNADVEGLKEEAKELEASITELNLLINDKIYRQNNIKSKLREYKKIFAHPRRSVIGDENGTIVVEHQDTIENRENIIVVTNDGYVKNISKRSFGASEYHDLKLKDGDAPIGQFYSNQRDKVILITSKGNYVSLPTYKIDECAWKDVGEHVNNIVPLSSDEKIVYAFNFENNVEDCRTLVLASKNGQIKRTRVKDLGIAKLPKVSNVMTLDENDRLISAALASSDKVETNVSVVTKDGNAIAYPIDQIPVIGKNGSGVKNLNLKDNDSIAAIFLNESSKEYVVIACEQGAKRIKTSSITIGKRTNQPKSVVLQSKTNPLFVINAFAVSNSDKISVLDSSNKWEVINASQISIGDIDTRVSLLKGKHILKINTINSLSKENEEDKQEEPIVEEKEGFFE